MLEKTTNFRNFVSVSALALLLVGSLSIGPENAHAASSWRPGGSKDRLQGDSGSGSRPPSTRPAPPTRKPQRRCTSARCKKRSAFPPKQGAHAEKELVLPKPSIVVDPDPWGMVGSVSLIRVESVGSFTDYVGTEDSGAVVVATPRTAECRIGDELLKDALVPTQVSNLHSTPPMPLELQEAGLLTIHCRIFWDAHWNSTDGASGAITDRESWNERLYPVGGIVPVLVR